MTGGASSSSVHEQGNVPLQCPKLTYTNYTAWALMMETILKACGLWKVIDAQKETDGKKKIGGEHETTIDEKAENTAKGMIFQTLPQDMLMQVAQYTTANEVWNSIKVKHLGADLVQKARLQTLRSELETLKMKPHESTSEFAGKLSSIQAKFKSLGGTLKDKVLVRKLLNSVPKKFLPIVVSIEQYQEIDTMQFEEAVGRIIAFEERLKSQDEPENNYQNKLLLASSNNQGGGRGHGRNFTKNKSSYGKGTSRVSIDKSKLRCYKCGEHGHFAKECTKWKHNKIKQEESHLIYDTDNEPTLL
ncbi:zinc finger, CCHC-type containing protein [Tanacetum coccineum]